MGVGWISGLRGGSGFYPVPRMMFIVVVMIMVLTMTMRLFNRPQQIMRIVWQMHHKALRSQHGVLEQENDDEQNAGQFNDACKMRTAEYNRLWAI